MTDYQFINLGIVITLALANLVAVPFVKGLLQRMEMLEKKHVIFVKENTEAKIEILNQHQDFKLAINDELQQIKLTIAKEYMGKVELKEFLSPNLMKMEDKLSGFEKLLRHLLIRAKT